MQSVIPLLALYLTKEIIDAVAGGLTSGERDAGRLTMLLAVAGGVAILGAGLRTLSTLVMEAQGVRLGDRVQEVLHAKSVEVDLQYYESRSITTPCTGPRWRPCSVLPG